MGESYLAMRDCIGPFTKEVARRVRRSSSLVYKWTQPAESPDDSGERNPAELLDEIMNEAERRGRDKLALAPLYWLNMEHGIVAIKMPALSGETQISASLISCIKEFAELAAATSDAIADNRISTNERRHIEAEGEEAVRAIFTLLYIVKKSTR
jgi:hypothetical protein